MKEQFYDLSIDMLDDRTIRLEQRGYCGESAIINLHPQQALHIAYGLSVDAHQVQINGLVERIATLERRILWMRDRFEECSATLPSDMYERCAKAFAFDAWLTASVDVANEFCADFPDVPSKLCSSPVEASLLSLADGGLPSVAGGEGSHPDNRHKDLFSDRAGEKQNDHD